MGEQINGLRERLIRCLDGVIDQDVIDNILFCFDRACGLAQNEGRQAGLKIAVDRLVKQKSESGGVDVAQEIIALQEHMYEESFENPETTYMKLKEALVKSQIAYMESKTAALESDDGLISISAEGLEAELEASMLKILERIQIREADELAKFLLSPTDKDDQDEQAAEPGPAPIINPDKDITEISKRVWLKPMDIVTLPARKTDNFNKPNPAEGERLALLLEEVGESLQVVGKIQRHGYESHNPFFDEGSNRELLEKELGHVRHAMILLCESGDLSKAAIHRSAKLKKESVKPYLHHQE